ncbi:hypothetical protein PCE1_003919 [Barthelona sp. PCE]
MKIVVYLEFRAEIRDRITANCIENVVTSDDILLKPSSSEELIEISSAGDIDLFIISAIEESHLIAILTHNPTVTIQYPFAGVPPHVLRAVLGFPDVTLCNNHSNGLAVGRYAFSLTLALTQHICFFDEEVRNGNWRKNERFHENEVLDNVTIGLLGVGNIARGFSVPFRTIYPGARFIGYRRVNKPTDLCEEIVTDLEEFFDRSTIVICSLPHTEATEAIVTRDLLRRTSYFVNVGRGGVVDEEGLYLALKENELRGAAMDVFWDELKPRVQNEPKYPYRFPFHDLPRGKVILSPHRADSPTWADDKFAQFSENIQRLRTNQALINVVSKHGY